MISACLYTMLTRCFPDLGYITLNTRTLSDYQGVETERADGVIYITTVVAALGLVLLVPYVFVKEHSAKPPIKSFVYNMTYIFNNFRTIIADMLRERHFILFIVAVVGIQFGTVYVAVLFQTVEIDVFNSAEHLIEIKWNIFFLGYVISFFVTPVVLHKLGPRIVLNCLLVMLVFVLCVQMTVVFESHLDYISCVLFAIINASVCFSFFYSFFSFLWLQTMNHVSFSSSRHEL